MQIHNIPTLSVNIKLTCTSLRHRGELETSGLFFHVWRRVHMKSIFAGNVLYCVLLQCHVCKTLLNLQCVVLLQRTWIYVGHVARLSYLCYGWVFSDQEWQSWAHINELKPAIYMDMSQAMSWIYIGICHFRVQWLEMRGSYKHKKSFYY